METLIPASVFEVIAWIRGAHKEGIINSGNFRFLKIFYLCKIFIEFIDLHKQSQQKCYFL